METKEVARDIVALGSIPFFILVLARVSILNDPYYLLEIAVAGVLFLILAFVFKSEKYLGMGLLLVAFLSIHYNDLKFTLIASAMYVIMVLSQFYLKENKKKIFLSILFGAISTGLSYYLIRIIF